MFSKSMLALWRDLKIHSTVNLLEEPGRRLKAVFVMLSNSRFSAELYLLRADFWSVVWSLTSLDVRAFEYLPENLVRSQLHNC